MCVRIVLFLLWSMDSRHPGIVVIVIGIGFIVTFVTSIIVVVIRFVLTASLQQQTVKLTRDIPQRGSVASGKQQQFSYRVLGNNNNNNFTVRAAITPLSGNGEVLLSLSTTNQSHPINSVTDDDNVVVVVNSLSGLSAGSIVFVNVWSRGGDSVFTVRVSQESESENNNKNSDTELLTLLMGTPQNDEISWQQKQQQLIYLIMLPAGHEELDLQVVIIMF